MNSYKFNWGKWLTWPSLITFTIVFLVYLIVSLLRLDPDFGWHLKSGEYFLNHGIPSRDIFTYTATNFPWINHEWLSDIFVFLAHSAVGYTSLCAIYAGLWTFAIWLVGRKAHNLLVLAAVIATLPFAGVRAIIWSILGLAILINIVNSKNKRLRWLIPLLFLVWANLHGSFVVGFGYIIYTAIKQRSWKLAVIVPICTLATFINPYGVHLYVEVWRTVSDSSLRFRISEWSALSIPWMTVPFALIWMNGFSLTGLKNWQKYLGLDVLSFIAGVASMRTLVLFVILSIGVTNKRLRTVAAAIPSQLDKPRRRLIISFGTIAITVTLATVIWSYWGVSTKPEVYYPRKAVAYLKQHPCNGRLFNHYNYGGYLIWKLPTEKVYIDGRMPSWELNGQKYMDNYLKVLSDNSFRQQQFKKYDIHCVIMSKTGHQKEFIEPLKKEGWKVVADDPSSILLLHP